MPRALHVDADVTLSSPVGRLELTGRGGELGLALPSRRMPIRLLFPSLRNAIRRRRQLQRLADTLAYGSTTLTLTRGGVEIARVGDLSPTRRISLRPWRLMALFTTRGAR